MSPWVAGERWRYRTRRCPNVRLVLLAHDGDLIHSEESRGERPCGGGAPRWVRDRGGGCDADRFAGCPPTEGPESTHQTGGLRPRRAAEGMGLVEDEELQAHTFEEFDIDMPR